MTWGQATFWSNLRTRVALSSITSRLLLTWSDYYSRAVITMTRTSIKPPRFTRVALRGSPLLPCHYLPAVSFIVDVLACSIRVSVFTCQSSRVGVHVSVLVCQCSRVDARVSMLACRCSRVGVRVSVLACRCISKTPKVYYYSYETRSYLICSDSEWQPALSNILTTWFRLAMCFSSFLLFYLQ
jgi:hypothetical protein